MAGLFYYFVEGECEKALLSALMHSTKEECYICPGKIEVFNIINQKLSVAKVMSLKRGTTVVFVYDTDIKKTDILETNIETIVKHSNIKYENIYFFQSVKNLEDEIVYSCSDINSINELLNTNGKEDFKKKFINHKDIVSKLLNVGFKIEKMWSRTPSQPFDSFEQCFHKISKNALK